MTIPAIPWDTYKGIINSAHDSLNKEVIVWRKWLANFDRHGEDSTQDEFQDINLDVLIQYNFFRTWPIATETMSGTMDTQSMTVYINLKYLSDNNWVNAEGNFDFDTAMDRFIHNGLTYICKGFSPVAQAGDEPLLFMLNMQREEKTNE